MQHNMKSHSLKLMIALTLTLLWAGSAQAAYRNVAGVARCFNRCFTVHTVVNTTNNTQTTNVQAFAGCQALCIGIDTAFGCFNQTSCMQTCRAAGGTGSYVGYYGGVLPCVAFCQTLFP